MYTTRRSLSAASGKLLSAMKAREATCKDLMPSLPASLHKFFGASTSALQTMEEFARRQPALLEEIIRRKAKNPTAAGVLATTAEPKMPQQ